MKRERGEAIEISHPYFESGWMANHHQRGQGVPMSLLGTEVAPVVRKEIASRQESAAGTR
jgi:hypothetical protein